MDFLSIMAPIYRTAMEVLFLNTFATFEAWMLLLCLLSIAGFYLFDGYQFLRNVFFVFFPKKLQTPPPETPTELSDIHTNPE
jgi:hypothetical protein